MATVKLKIAGRDVAFQSDDDAARILLAMERVANGAEKSSAKAASKTKTDFDPLEGTVAFLREIQGAGAEGASSETVARALHCDSRGIGRRLLEVEAVLKAASYRRDAVLTTKRLAVGGRLYRPGAEFKDALEDLSKKLERR